MRLTPPSTGTPVGVLGYESDGDVISIINPNQIGWDDNGEYISPSQWEKTISGITAYSTNDYYDIARLAATSAYGIVEIDVMTRGGGFGQVYTYSIPWGFAFDVYNVGSRYVTSNPAANQWHPVSPSKNTNRHLFSIPSELRLEVRPEGDAMSLRMKIMKNATGVNLTFEVRIRHVGDFENVTITDLAGSGNEVTTNGYIPSFQTSNEGISLFENESIFERWESGTFSRFNTLTHIIDANTDTRLLKPYLPASTSTNAVCYDANGNLTKCNVNFGGDNLGNHTLTQDLITNGWNIRNGAASPMRLNMASSAATFTNNGTPVFTVNPTNVQIPGTATTPTVSNSLYMKQVVNEFGFDKIRPFATTTTDVTTGSGGAATILEQRIVTEADFFRRSRVLSANINSATSTADPAYAITGLGISDLKAGQYKYTATIFHSKNSGSSTARSDFEFTIGGTFDAGSVRWHVDVEGGSGLIATRNATGTYIGPTYPGTASYATTLVLTVQFTADGGSITPAIEPSLNAGGLNDFINILENSSAVIERL